MRLVATAVATTGSAPGSGHMRFSTAKTPVMDCSSLCSRVGRFRRSIADISAGAAGSGLTGVSLVFGVPPLGRCHCGRASAGLCEGDLGQRAALHPLIEDGLRPRTVRTAAAVELLGEDGQATPALRR